MTKLIASTVAFIGTRWWKLYFLSSTQTMRFTIFCFRGANFFTKRCDFFANKFERLVMLKIFRVFKNWIAVYNASLHGINHKQRLFRCFRSFYCIPLCSAKCIDNRKFFVLLPNIMKWDISCDNIDILFMGEYLLNTHLCRYACSNGK